eukprot:366086-Chlamydomonas_euryale.AAC.14
MATRELIKRCALCLWRRVSSLIYAIMGMTACDLIDRRYLRIVCVASPAEETRPHRYDPIVCGASPAAGTRPDRELLRQDGAAGQAAAEAAGGRPPRPHLQPVQDHAGALRAQIMRRHCRLLRCCLRLLPDLAVLPHP